ncbi:hypothetical protein EBU95_21040, partial [bacterium]|nr:hypothetical protein [bacterium]
MKTLIIDGNNLLHRVFWIAKSKDQVGEGNYLHLYMFINCVKRYVEQYQPDEIYCCWDEKPEKLKNVRGNLNTNYKANRNKETAVEVYAFNEQIKNLLQSLGIKNLFPLQYEADDVMCYLTRNLPGTKAIITVDKDLFQLVNEHVVVFEPIKKVEVTAKNFEQVTGTTQEKFVKIKALKGDKSDNVDGLKGFGEKTIEKYFRGEIELTPDQQLQYEQNLQLM